MNLVKEPWIPVVKTNGEKTEASVLDVFLSGAAYADLAVRSHERVALMRLLICIAQAALDGPENNVQWEKVPGLLPAKADEYLTKSEWKDSFHLFHQENPFCRLRDWSLPTRRRCASWILPWQPATIPPYSTIGATMPKKDRCLKGNLP